jgi:hypothetical protein
VSSKLEFLRIRERPLLSFRKTCIQVKKKQFFAAAIVLRITIQPMKQYERALLGFEAKAKKIIYKYTEKPEVTRSQYAYIRLSGFFGSFNARLLQVDDALNKESLGIINRYKNNDHVDLGLLLENLNQKRLNAKMEFIKIQQPCFEW